MRAFWLFSLMLGIQSPLPLLAKDELSFTSISNAEVDKFVEDMQGKKYSYVAMAGPSKATAEEVGGVNIEFTIEAESKDFLARMSFSSFDADSGQHSVRAESFRFQSTPPYLLKVGLKSESIREKDESGKLLSLTSRRLDFGEQTINRTDSDSSKETTTKSCPMKKEEIPTLKSFFLTEIIARKNAPAGTRFTYSTININKLLEAADEEFEGSLETSKSELRVLENNKDNIHLQCIEENTLGNLEKRSPIYRKDGVMMSELMSEVPYSEVFLSKTSSSKPFSTLRSKLNKNKSDLSPAEQEKLLAQIKRGKIVFRIKESSRGIPSGFDQKVVGNHVTLSKWIGGRELQQEILATDLSHESDKSIPQEILAEVKSKFTKGMTDLEKLEVIRATVHSKLQYKGADDSLTFEDVFRLGVGDCNDFSSIYASLLRLCGIAAHVNLGLVYDKSLDGRHAWVEAKIDGKWIPIEATSRDSARMLEAPEWLLLKLQSFPSYNGIKESPEKFFGAYQLELVEDKDANEAAPHSIDTP